MRRDEVYLKAISRFGDARERELELRMYADMQAALLQALKRYQGFLRMLDDVRTGVYPPPAYYLEAGEDAVERWKRGFLTEQLRRGKVIEGIAQELSRAGRSLPERVRDTMAEIYTFAQNASLGKLSKEAGIDLGIAGFDVRTARVLYQANETPLTQIAFQRYANAEDIEDRLRREFLIAMSNGEGNHKLTKRVAEATSGQTAEEYLKNGRDPFLRGCKSVVRYEVSCARRIVQTERTRVQNQASYNASQHAADLGVRVANEWSCQMIPATEKSSGSRETHIRLDGQKRPQGVPFDLIDGDKLLYPGDPRGKACNVINCHCTLIPTVLLPGERM